MVVILKRIYAIPIAIVVIIVLVFPTVHPRTRQEPYTVYETVTATDLEATYRCSDILEDRDYWEWSELDLPINLRIEVNVASTEDIYIIIKTATGTISNMTLKKHDYNILAEGPSLYLKVWNPALLGLGPSAVVSGDIKVYHEYMKEVPVTKNRTVPYEQWLPWWMP